MTSQLNLLTFFQLLGLARRCFGNGG